ncbi:class I SAM-dependent methyltransferase [Actinosynnema sp. NPDC047251]|uniref:Methyltransferase type 12 n=1 Tax=Saccharothrix espanaensis (strain ATCC 51144 / DSM 44229 / JCM 9112 / NBRC 15066 / NRRL 15764) TaxID=1179773 RepID=K0K6U0_SACES|nr:class I SAM-dependent methyltransferase [Saccharothrix espanaensis]CCH33247.1 Methyltransferase type 12 [Saccharothrix espanaensis DSM 44229]
MTDPDWLRLNRENWDDRVAVHVGSEFYDLPGFRAGRSALRPFEPDEVGDVTGKRLLHLQCHLGLDTLSWARLGAAVTGLDFSPAAVDAARTLAGEVGLDAARFVVADVHDAREALGEDLFDVVYTGFGALVWLPDVYRWARVVASLLAEGGFLYLAEFHPVSQVLGEDGRSLAYDYFQSAGETWDEPHTYTDGPALTRTKSVQWQHSLGDIVTAITRAGLRLEFLRERGTTLFQANEALVRVGPDDYRFPPGHPSLPMMFSLRASKS